MRSFKFFALLFALLMITGLVRQAQAAEHLWRYALEEIEGSLQDTYAQKFKSLLDEKSNGKIHLDIYPYGQLGTSGQITELLQGGAIEFAFQSPGHLGSYIPEVQVFSIHYLFPDDQAVIKKVLKEGKNTYNVLGKYYEKKDLKLLSIIPEGWQVWTTQKEIHSPKDFEGMKFRVMTSPMLVEAYKAYGANPTPMPYSEIYSALQLKMIEGQVQPYFATQEMKFYEVTKYLISAKQLMFICTVVANKDFYNGLPADLKQVVDESIAGATDFIFGFEQDFNQKRLQMMLKDKPSLVHYELTDQEKAAFKEKAEPVQQVYLKIGGEGAQEVLDAVKTDIQNAMK
jgi:tripartite ATP-independent transporter DctP family solute receptor